MSQNIEKRKTPKTQNTQILLNHEKHAKNMKMPKNMKIPQNMKILKNMKIANNNFPKFFFRLLRYSL